MKLKLDENGNAVVQDGKPVYVADDGKEITYDAPSMHATISRLNREAQGHREAKEAAEAQLQAFKGLDPEAARKALELAGNLDAQKLIDAGKVEEIKAAAIRSVEEKYAPFVKEAETLRNEIRSEKIGGSFARSEFIAKRTILPPDIAQATFGQHFELKDGQILAKDPAGNLIYSDANPGNPAGFDEALEKIVNGYAHRDRILKGSGHSGSGATGVDGSGGARTINREKFAALSPEAQAKTVAAVREGTMQIVD